MITLNENQEHAIWQLVYRSAELGEFGQGVFFQLLHNVLNAPAFKDQDNAEPAQPVSSLPSKWRVRARSCDPSAKDAFLWAADELESAAKSNREQADECRRIIQGDLPAYRQIEEMRKILEMRP
jgi:hypothetical protein